MTRESVSARFCCRKKLALYSRFALPPPLFFCEQKFEVEIVSCRVFFFPLSHTIHVCSVKDQVQ